jgi:hypothetical protein
VFDWTLPHAVIADIQSAMAARDREYRMPASLSQVLGACSQVHRRRVARRHSRPDRKMWWTDRLFEVQWSGRCNVHHVNRQSVASRFATSMLRCVGVLGHPRASGATELRAGRARRITHAAAPSAGWLPAERMPGGRSRRRRRPAAGLELRGAARIGNRAQVAAVAGCAGRAGRSSTGNG